MIVLDASVLIAYLQPTDAHHERATTLLMAEADEEFAANALTIAEVLVAPIRAGQLPTVQRALTELEVREVPFPVATALKLAQLRAVTGLRMPDCCVLLAAADEQARIASFDERLRRAARAHGLGLA